MVGAWKGATWENLVSTQEQGELQFILLFSVFWILILTWFFPSACKCCPYVPSSLFSILPSYPPPFIFKLLLCHEKKEKEKKSSPAKDLAWSGAAAVSGVRVGTVPPIQYFFLLLLSCYCGSLIWLIRMQILCISGWMTFKALRPISIKHFANYSDWVTVLKTVSELLEASMAHEKQVKKY